MSSRSRRTTGDGEKPITPLTNAICARSVIAPGTYRFRAVVFYQTAGVAAIGISVGANYSGTYTIASSPVTGTVAGTGFAGGLVANVATTSIVGSTAPGATGSPSVAILEGTLVATGSGSLAISFSQNASNATATTLMIGSYLEIVQAS